MLRKTFDLWTIDSTSKKSTRRAFVRGMARIQAAVVESSPLGLRVVIATLFLALAQTQVRIERKKVWRGPSNPTSDIAGANAQSSNRQLVEERGPQDSPQCT